MDMGRLARSSKSEICGKSRHLFSVQTWKCRKFGQNAYGELCRQNACTRKWRWWAWHSAQGWTSFWIWSKGMTSTLKGHDVQIQHRISVAHRRKSNVNLCHYICRRKSIDVKKSGASFCLLSFLEVDVFWFHCFVNMTNECTQDNFSDQPGPTSEWTETQCERLIDQLLSLICFGKVSTDLCICRYQSGWSEPQLADLLLFESHAFLVEWEKFDSFLAFAGQHCPWESPLVPCPWFNRCHHQCLSREWIIFLAFVVGQNRWDLACGGLDSKKYVNCIVGQKMFYRWDLPWRHAFESGAMPLILVLYPVCWKIKCNQGVLHAGDNCDWCF